MKAILRVAIVREIPKTGEVQVLVDTKGRPLWTGVSKLRRAIAKRLPLKVQPEFQTIWKSELEKLKAKTIRGA